MATKIYIIAGEASGDLHGGNLVKQMLSIDRNLSIRAWGGERMQEAGASVIKHYRDLAFMGFTEVLMNIRTILKNLSFCRQDILDFKPDAIVLIDYPGFNLRIAEFAYQHNIPVLYYISPQIWAWKQSRIEKIKKFVTRMFVILPFEREFYSKFGYQVSFPGHPLLDAIDQFKSTEPASGMKWPKEYLVVLPGSRKQEIKKMLPVMLKAIEGHFDFPIFIGKAPSVDESFYLSLIGNSNAKLFHGGTYALLAGAKAALVTSGTATLETALFKVPEVVCYKGGYLSYLLAKSLVKVKYISLVNLILDRAAVPELIQQEFTPEICRVKLTEIIEKGAARNRMLDDFEELQQKLGGPGASLRTAEEMLDIIKKNQIV
jgi:lipid-A-disaccharide synthase